jgi:hypothetical protein
MNNKGAYYFMQQHITQPTSYVSLAEQELVGTWRLISQIARRADGTNYYPCGERPSGLLMYDAYGNMSVQLMGTEFTNSEFSDFKTTIEGFLSYYGTYHVNRRNRSVTHHILGGSHLVLIGTDQVWQYQFNADELTLTAEGKSADSEAETRILVWKRLSTRIA